MEDKDWETFSRSGEAIRIQFPLLMNFTFCFCEEKRGSLKKKKRPNKDTSTSKTEGSQKSQRTYSNTGKD